MPGQAMNSRELYLAAYDVAAPGRLAATLKLVRGFATGGQKSVHEIWLGAAEKAQLLEAVTAILDATEDRFLLLRLDPRATVMTLGLGKEPADPNFFYLG
jgi:CRISPR-associated protein Cas2